jgi:hypothetical protein
MDQDNQDNQPPDFDQLGGALHIISRELPRLRNIQQIQLSQQITEIKAGLANLRIKSRNSSRYAANRDEALLDPLVSPETGIPIPNCPPTVGSIDHLTARQANRILAALQIPAPAALADKKKAVHYEFH